MASFGEALEALRDPLLNKIWVGDAVRHSVIPEYVGLLMMEGVHGTIAGGVLVSHKEVSCGDQNFSLPAPDLSYRTVDEFEGSLLRAMGYGKRDS